MKSSTRSRIALGMLLSLALAIVPQANAQTPSPAATQVGWSWAAQSAGSGSLGGFGVTGLRYFSIDWVVSGSVSGCTVTLDGAVTLGGAFSTGSIVSSQTCTSSNSVTTTSVSENVQAQLSFNITGSGTVTFIVRGYAQNPGTAGSSSSTIISPLDGSGNVNVDCKLGCGSSSDPCSSLTRTPVVLNLTANTQLIAGTSGKQTYVCFIQFGLGSTADNIAMVEGTGTICGTTTVGMAGGNTSATGWNLQGYGSVTAGEGLAWAFKTATTGDSVCFLVSSASQVSGVVQYVQQ